MTDFSDISGLAGAYDRSSAKPQYKRVAFVEDRLGQGAEINEVQSIIAARNERIAQLIVKDGNRVNGADVIVDVTSSSIFLAAGQVYVKGDVRDIDEYTFSGIDFTGEITVGVRLSRATVTSDDDPDLLGLHPGTEAEGEPGAGRIMETVAWGYSTDGQAGDLYPVYVIKDGVVIDQTPPPDLGGIQQMLAIYDDDAHGSYIVSGCMVTALGKIDGSQNFAIESGVANIRGFKRTRYTALRHVEPEDADSQAVTAEAHTLTASPCTLTLNHNPLAVVSQVVIEKEVTETIVKGITDSLDALGHSSVLRIVSVSQGGTTYVPSHDYGLTTDKVDWSLSGPEPAPGSSYSVTYRYYTQVTPDATSTSSITVSGGVTGGTALVSYTFKLPRIDLLCLDSDGNSVYVRGLPALSDPLPPICPSSLLKLAEVSNTWADTPDVLNNGVHAYHFDDIDRMYNRLVDALDLVALNRLRQDIDSREPVAKKGVFVDPFTDDSYRDAGVSQDMAVFAGVAELAIDATVFNTTSGTPLMLDYTDEIIVQQSLRTRCMKINPYQTFNPLPIGLSISPAVDYWTVYATTYLSPITQTFRQSGSVAGTAVQSTEKIVARSKQVLPFLRQIAVAFTVSGMGAGEVLATLTFDGLNVKPTGTHAANSAGVVSGSFTIPANVTSGQKVVKATGGAGSVAYAKFTGQGELDIEVVQKITTVTITTSPVDSSSQNNEGGSGNSNKAGNSDPLAQTFAVSEARFVTAVDLCFCAKGNPTKPVFVVVVDVDNGLPTRNERAVARVDMSVAVLNQWTKCTFQVPCVLFPDRQYAVVIKTDDAQHSVRVARLGDFDADAQKYVAAQPYTVGVLLSSSNAVTWTPHQGTDLSFRLYGAVFAPLSKTVTLGQFNVTNASDLMVLGGVYIPTPKAGFAYQIERANGDVERVMPGQNWQLSEYITERVTLKAVLTGSRKISPVLYPGTELIAGSLRSSGTYVSDTFTFGAGVRLSTYVKEFLPAGSNVSIYYDKTDGNWISVPVNQASLLNLGWVESEYRLTPITATQGRLKMVLSGTPAARPSLSDLRAITV